MSEVEKYKLISNVGFILALVFLLFAIAFFFAFNIKKIVLDLMGITERRAILRINEANQETGNEAKITTEKIVSRNLNQLSMETTLLVNVEFSIIQDISFIQSDVTL